MMIFKLEIHLQHPRNFYLRNRARPMIYDWSQRPRPLQLHVSDRSAAEVECPFCKSELNELATLVKCSSCHTYHHQTCFMENGRCSVYGCVGFAVPVLKSSPIQETES
ncbi:hypothetical protein L0156_21175 [bacterium]|nr:hypothetical protein [bacterium]